jgi:beta-fructofuranosidase
MTQIKTDTGTSLRPRPVLHFAPRRNWMNDPNGLIQRGGRVHLFYQYNPSGVTHGNIAWGHASSADLWRWEDHPLALVPDPAGPDADGCWSGCAVVHEGRPHLLYTGLRGTAQLPCLAVADDPDLNSWSRYAGNPVIAEPPPGATVFRDHAAWRAGDQWYQVVGGGLADRGGALFLYRSADLLHWEYLGVLAAAADHGLDGKVWECPDLFFLGDTAVVLLSVHDGTDGQYTMWLTGSLADGRFSPRASGRCDAADRYYAPQSAWLADGRRICFGWLRESLNELEGPDRTRVGAISLPRELYLADGELRARPAHELTAARGHQAATAVIDGHATVPLPLAARDAAAAELLVHPARGGAYPITVRLRGLNCPDVTIQADGNGARVREGERPLTAPLPRRRPQTEASQSPAPAVRIYYDNGILEVFPQAGPPAAVICDRDGRYGRVDITLAGDDGCPAPAADVTAWWCGTSAAGG